VNESTKIIQKYLNETISKKELDALNYYIKHPKIKEAILPTLMLEADLRTLKTPVSIVKQTMDKIKNNASSLSSDSAILKKRHYRTESKFIRKPSPRSSFSKKLQAVDEATQLEKQKLNKRKDLITLCMATLGFFILGATTIAYHLFYANHPVYMAKVTKSFGEVKIIRQNETVPVDDQTEVHSGDEFILGKDAECRFVFLSDETQAVVSENTRLSITENKHLIQITLHQGTLYGHLHANQMNKPMQILTSYAKAAMREGQFRIEHSDELTQLSVSAGQASFESESGVKKVTVDKNEIAKIGAKIPLKVTMKPDNQQEDRR